jgi:uncharacterized protein
MVLDPLFLKGIEHFNRQDFFDAHEAWEELWKKESGPAKDFLQGLIQAATALHHFKKRNLKGAKILSESAIALLAPYDEFWRMPVRRWLGDVGKIFKDLQGYSKEDLPGRYDPGKNSFPILINEGQIPRITLLPEIYEDANDDR